MAPTPIKSWTKIPKNAFISKKKKKNKKKKKKKKQKKKTLSRDNIRRPQQRYAETAKNTST